MTQFCMEIQNIKRYASDLQTFISMRVLQSKVTENDRRLESMIKNESLENVTIQLTIDDKIKSILTFVNTFGRILIKKSSPDKTHMQSHKNKQALASMPNTIQSINNFSIALELKIDTSNYFNANEKLVKLDAQCNTEYIIQLSSPYSAFDVELIDENTVAVTTGKSVGFGKRRGISIVDLTKRNVIRFIDLPNHTYGITFDGISLICCVEDRDLHMISSIDYCLTTVPNTVLPWFSYVSTYACKIFFTNPNKHTVSCCLYNGTPVWEFKDENLFKTPCGITVDNKGHFFVVGRDSCNVFVISANGKYIKQILNKEDGLRVPAAIFIDKIGKQLLVTSDQKVAYLYRIAIN
ncbi:Hypothetical predicted protein [Mytilus galloprovincialis]|uniref:Uncharacterized protein n=1 Tax=Mytilus galloprovincialis TaxID=29158 RepID=A0A8B6CIJ4_MYTGA|nr:Hypothetical predicted protein [Mytilus galloprovincialis]